MGRAGQVPFLPARGEQPRGLVQESQILLWGAAGMIEEEGSADRGLASKGLGRIPWTEGGGSRQDSLPITRSPISLSSEIGGETEKG